MNISGQSRNTFRFQATPGLGSPGKKYFGSDPKYCVADPDFTIL
jgi:hypothetical protein